MWRAYFIVGDLLACTLAGAAAALLTQAIVPADWFVVLGMVVGMVAGVFAGIFCGILFTPLFGGMEVMLPVSLSTMVAGMAGGMAQTMARGALGIGWSEAVLGGALCGLACLAFVYILQVAVRGEAKIRGAR